MSSQDLVAELEWRGLVHQTTDQELGQKLQARPMTLYCGFDPSADSLHVGSLMGLLNLARFQKAGHKPIALVGGGTGFIGDPSGKSAERSLLSADQLAENVEGIKSVMERIIDFSGSSSATLVNNADWLCNISLIEFLRDIGKHFTVNHMMDKESVRARLEDRDHGISYTEFSYMLLQAYDFLHLHDHFGCEMQVGGSDQFGNITAGCELIRRVRARRLEAGEIGAEDASAQRAFGLTWPLLTRSDGKKFGKTEEGAIWLSADRTSPYVFYQYWINTPDEDAGMFLRYFTELSRDEVEELEKKIESEPQRREAQRILARTLTEKVHGITEREQAEVAAQALFGGSLDGIGEEALKDLFKEAPGGELTRNQLDGGGMSIVALMASSGLWKSKGDAKRAVQGGAANLNNTRVNDLGRMVKSSDLLHGKYLVLRKGKKEYFLYQVN